MLDANGGKLCYVVIKDVLSLTGGGGAEFFWLGAEIVLRVLVLQRQGQQY